jgi:hypothetical protein
MLIDNIVILLCACQYRDEDAKGRQRNFDAIVDKVVDACVHCPYGASLFPLSSSPLALVVLSCVNSAAESQGF